MANDGDGAGQQVCRVYDSEDSFTAFVQFLLACLALASLWLKRLNEVPRRKFWTWFMDVSKQAFGACYAHVLNMIIAAVIAGNVRGEAVLEDQCAWYAINYLIDTTLGLVLSIMFLRLLDDVANERDWVSLKHSGVYVGKEGILHWLNQMLAWLAILTIVKVIICFFMWLMSEPLAYMGLIMFEPFQSNIRFELLFVMIFFPGLLNVIYFWITDGYLKANSKHAGAHEPEFIDTGGLVAEALCDVNDGKKETLLGRVDTDLGDSEHYSEMREKAMRQTQGKGYVPAMAQGEARIEERPQGTLV
uniref:Transmembrane protein 110 n=1 Tax=Trieres chinensis TaxID=1514140 RepID=A0A7S1Z5X6_TRICV|mmetsp:Transcript_18482/g.37473  ORF Transcript_18482/g.37473 Transcript_18482/m.37473 type:complete len:303 (+) Transcript_18482:178-1086(+)|eukprot:CAMPEP_0183307248 /NCGR_PEP_ID=MMETSP0160_2-20130417/17219_1 /TAXON_ID=2839 ORGANISM="Odontella Sinensis, Strain Grunow 1884" /NCGR_SAMPLE_ID=MMETSP0160_2 /ASSEMBLY_ACC=CAM_ASM_000250 /LENGTH=302 /DNA_ID=CAMNT_0025470799 /DNA_START=162 /DNA_END=1070 /DNA_ORIENTATION=+